MVAVAIEILLLPFLGYPLLLGDAICTLFVSFPLFLVLLELAIESNVRVSLCIQSKRDENVSNNGSNYAYKRMSSSSGLLEATKVKKVEHDGVNGAHVRSRVAARKEGPEMLLCVYWLFLAMMLRERVRLQRQRAHKE